MVKFVGSSSAACKSPLTLSPILLFVLSMIFMVENQNQLQSSPTTTQTDATSSLSCAILLNIPQDPGAMHDEYHQLPQEGQQVPSDLLPFGRSSNHRVVDRTNEQCSVKWMSSKMRLMRKMLKQRAQSFHDQVQMNRTRSSINIRNNSNNDIVRVCSNCETTKTPLWRGGPKGPKSLCNACGIRQMKARRAMRAAAVGLTYREMQQKERSDVDQTVPFKKRFKINVPSASSQENLQFDDITTSLSNNLAFQQSFPQEERDAAILLMALSCGLIHA